MNVERLHRVIFEFNEDLKKSNVISVMQTVTQHLQDVITEPNQPAYQTNLVNSLEELYKALEQSNYNSYTPMYKEVIKELTPNNDFGFDLIEKIKSIFSSNIITPGKALEDLTKILNKITEFQGGISNTLLGFVSLKIEREQLSKGECELGYSIPRIYIKNHLVELKNEIGELIFILNILTEAVTGKQERYKVKTISSSDFLFYVIIGLQVADTLSKATERILNHYKQILEIKVLRNQLAEKGVPEKQTESIEKYANGIMETEIKKIANEIIEEKYKGDNGRKNEIENGLVIALNKLANRIDNGFNIEIRVEQLPKPKEENITDDYKENSNLINSILNSAKKIDYLEAKGKSILQLPEGETI